MNDEQLNECADSIFSMVEEQIQDTIDKDSLYDKNWKWTTSLPLLLEEIKTNVRFSKDEKKGVCLGFDKSNYNINGFKTDIKTSLSRWRIKF